MFTIDPRVTISPPDFMGGFIKEVKRVIGLVWRGSGRLLIIFDPQLFMMNGRGSKS